MKATLIIASFSLTASLSAQTKAPPHKTVLTGIASYYHVKFHGRRMANGQIYSNEAFTAASNRIPLNRWVKVTNLSNGRSVIVKITDRMARDNKRLIDLSQISARELRMLNHGLKRVEVELLTSYKPPENETVQKQN